MARYVFWAQVAQMYFLGPKPQGHKIFWKFIILLDLYNDSWKNEVLFVKIGARVPDLWLNTFFGPKLPYDMMMNCFCGMVDRWKMFSIIFSRDHCQRSSPSWISDTQRAGFKPAQNLSSGFAEWSCVVMITTTPWRHIGPRPKMPWLWDLKFFHVKPHNI